MAGTTIVLVDDDVEFRNWLRTWLNRQTGLEVVAEARDGVSAMRQIERWDPDVVILDVSMPEHSGVEITRRLVAGRSTARVIGLSWHDESPFVEAMLSAGASAYVLKEHAVAELRRAIRAVASGRSFLGTGLSAPRSF